VVYGIPSKKRGLGDKSDKKIKLYIRYLRARGGGIDTTVPISCAEAMVSRVGKKLLNVNGGTIDLSKSWAKSIFGRMG